MTFGRPRHSVPRPGGVFERPHEDGPGLARIDHVVNAEALCGVERAELAAELGDELGPPGGWIGRRLDLAEVGHIHRAVDGHGGDLSGGPGYT